MLAAGPKSKDVAHAAIPRHLDPLEFAAWWGASPYTWQVPIVEALCAPERPGVAYVQVPRKNGKSYAAALVALDEMVRVGGQVFLIADSERNLKSALFFELCSLVRNSPQLSACVLTYKDHLECPASGGMISLRPNNLGASQSINPTLVLFDEVHMQKTDAIWNGMMLAGDANLRSLLLGITTPGYETVSLAQDLYQSVKAGKTWGVIHEAADYDCDIEADGPLLEANPILQDRPELIERFRYDESKISQIDHRRFRLGQWTTGATRWLEYGRWEALTAPAEYAAGERLWVGFDGSYSRDSTAVVACNRQGHVKLLGLWESFGRKGWKVPRDEVQAVLDQVMGDCEQTTLHADPYGWHAELAEWEQRWGPERVIEYPWNSPARSIEACDSFESAVLKGVLTHDGDKRMAAHISHATPKVTSTGTYIVKPSMWSPAKIDAAVAACIAVSQAVIAPAAEDVFIM